jgi:hypothetical protein
MKMKIWRDLHRWTGMILVAFVGFYCFTGLILNHRHAFSYFVEQQRSISPVPVQEPEQLRSFIESYKDLINRSDDPTVIRIKDGNIIEFLYGSHGKTTYVIDPKKGTMEKVDKIYQQPWTWLNNLHKAFKTSDLWLVVADGAALAILFLGLSGVLLIRLRVVDCLLLCGSVGMLVAAMLLG